MQRSDVLVSTDRDYVIVPRPYFDSEAWGKQRLKNCIVIQCYARGMKARTRARELRAAIRRAHEQTQEAEVVKMQALEEQRRVEINRRMHPRSGKDFEVLYDELEVWRLQELERIKASKLDEEEKKRANYMLLSKEVKLVQTIDRLKSFAKDENADKQIEAELEAMSAPKLWQMRDGKIAEVHTPYTTRAKELADLSRGLRSKNLSVDERLDVLMNVKWTVNEFNHALSVEIADLCDREADLLSRGRGDAFLDGARKRLVTLFQEFINTPTFNPEAERFRAKKTLLFDIKDMHQVHLSPNFIPSFVTCDV
jgi:hypothetical protein